jgi:hypothetical protein
VGASHPGRLSIAYGPHTQARGGFVSMCHVCVTGGLLSARAWLTSLFERSFAASQHLPERAVRLRCRCDREVFFWIVRIQRHMPQRIAGDTSPESVHSLPHPPSIVGLIGGWSAGWCFGNYIHHGNHSQQQWLRPHTGHVPWPDDLGVSAPLRRGPPTAVTG